MEDDYRALTAENILNLSLILAQPQDSGSNFPSRRPKKTLFSKLFSKKLALLGLILVSGLFFWFQDQPAYASRLGLNSQNVGLSSPLLASVGNNFIGGGDITIDGDALLPETGVIGTSADISILPQSDQISIYVVRPGDTLSGIAQMFGVSVNTIIWANDLTKGAVLREGQVLTILPINGVRHKVMKGETVESIAKKFKGDAKEIVQFNGLASAEELAVGQEILIPGGEEVPAPTSSGKPPASKPIGTTGPSYAGYYTRPVIGGVRTQGLHGYNGVDLASRSGSEILAAASGQVIVSKTGGWNGGYGTYVVISHPNGTQTLYAHLQKTNVFVGQQVTRGQVIGLMGATGKATGTHLHFEIRGAKNPF